MTKKTIPARKPGGDQNSTAENSLDTWLDTKLRNAYSSVLDEPIPEDLIQLLHQKLKD
jgi:hypothetical protein